MKTTVEHVSGSGLSFPIKVVNGMAVAETGWPLIRSCLFNLLAFEYGERYFQPDFGCNLERQLEEPNDRAAEAQLTYRLNQQITQWENRVTVTSVQSQRKLGKLHITVNVVLRNSNPIQTNTFDFIL